MGKSKKKNYLVIILVILLLAIAVGYAAFASQLNITGTATAKGNWSVHFVNSATITSSGSPAVAAADMNVAVDSGLKDATVTVNFTSPGQKVDVLIPVINDGTVDAKITGFTITAGGLSGATYQATLGDPTESTASSSYSFGAITASLNTANFAQNDTLTVNQTKNYTLSLEWPSNYEPSNDFVNDKVTFTITIDYEQAT